MSRADWNDEQAEFLRQHFNNEILPVLTPVAIEGLSPAPVLPGLQLFVAFSVSTGRARTKIVAVPVPGIFQRFVNIPTEGDIFVTPSGRSHSRQCPDAVRGRENCIRGVFSNHARRGCIDSGRRGGGFAEHDSQSGARAKKAVGGSAGDIGKRGTENEEMADKIFAAWAAMIFMKLMVCLAHRQ